MGKLDPSKFIIRLGRPPAEWYEDDVPIVKQAYGHLPFLWTASACYVGPDPEKDHHIPDIHPGEACWIDPPSSLEECVAGLLKERAHGNTGPEWFKDMAYLARRGYRSPAFNALLADVIAGKVRRRKGRPEDQIARDTCGGVWLVEVRKLQANGADYYTARDEVADRFGVSPRTVENWIALWKASWEPPTRS